MPDKKILHFPHDWRPDDNDAEGKALFDSLNARETDVSALHPLEIWIDREFLIAEVEAAIQAIKRKVPWETSTETQRDYLKAVLQQRVEFLEYLNGEKDERVYLAIYPVAEEPVVPLGEEADADDLPLEHMEDYGALGRLDTLDDDDDLPL